MFRALHHGLEEGREAARLAVDMRSRSQLRFDFLFSRLLRLGRLPGFNGLRQVDLGDLKVVYRFNRGDVQSFREVLIEEVYECSLPFQPQTILDLGGNIGLSSLWMHRRYFQNRPGGASTDGEASQKIVIVEPVPENAAVIRRNLEVNLVSGECLEAAVGQKTGRAWFQSRSESNLGQLISESVSNSTSMAVPVIGIREALDRLPSGMADLVKMDIEGGEQDLLSEDTDWLDRIRALMVEWHEDRADPLPLIANVERAGFLHTRINTARQENLSLFVRTQLP